MPDPLANILAAVVLAGIVVLRSLFGGVD